MIELAAFGIGLNDARSDASEHAQAKDADEETASELSGHGDGKAS